MNMEGSIFTHYGHLMRQMETFMRASLSHAKIVNLVLHHLTSHGASTHTITKIFIKLQVVKYLMFSFVKKMESNMYHAVMNYGCI